MAALVVGFFAIFHGNAHGTELPPGANGILYSIGFVIATGTLHAVGMGMGLIYRWPVGRASLRVVGAVRRVRRRGVPLAGDSPRG